MNKQSKSSQTLTENLSNLWVDSSLVEWISEKRQVFLWGVVALFVGLLLAYRFFSWSDTHSENDFLRAQALFNQFQQSRQEDAQDLKDLELIMSRHPELQAKFDGALAQTLMIEGNIPQAQAFAELTFRRTRPDQLGLYEGYSKTSLLIGEGQYEKALQQATQLKSRLEADENNYRDTALYAFNLVRIAILHQQLGQKEAELQAWKAIENLSDTSQAALSLNEVFKSGQASLNQYIRERK